MYKKLCEIVKKKKKIFVLISIEETLANRELLNCWKMKEYKQILFGC